MKMLARLILEVKGGEGGTREFVFSPDHMQAAVMILNTICSRRDAQEPTLWLESYEGSRVFLNNRLDYERSVAAAQRHQAGLEVPVFPVGR